MVPKEPLVGEEMGLAEKPIPKAITGTVDKNAPAPKRTLTKR